MEHFPDTIVAVATPAGRGGIGVVRVSGMEALSAVSSFLQLRRPLAAGRARYGKIIDSSTGEVLDEAVVTYFAGPRSYTGEDVVEVAAHGAPIVMDYLLRACCAAGARLAEPGEFTRRAFLSGRLDLTQAEAVGDLIEATTLEQARMAARQLGGALSREVGPAKTLLVELIAEMEAGIDFAEDDISVLPSQQIIERLATIATPLQRLERSFVYGRVVREGFRLALAGRPNAGKSSLFNRLLERDRAIVTALPGTTRDTIHEHISIEGIPVELVDTAGLRAGLDEAEQMGIAQSREAMADADVVLLVVDAVLPLDAGDLAIVKSLNGRTLVAVANKMDLVQGEIAVGGQLQAMGIPLVLTSALTGEGIIELRAAILSLLQRAEMGSQTTMVTNLRQHQAVTGSLRAITAAARAVQSKVPHEVLLLELYDGLRRLDELTGMTTPDDVLLLVFGKFCIGK